MIARVLVVDDEPLARERVVDLVRALAPDAAIREAADGDEAVRLIEEWAPEAVILDIQMPGRSGFAVVEAVGADRMPPTIFATAHDDHAVRAFEVAAVDYLLKPFDEDRFGLAWGRVTARRRGDEVLVHARRLSELVAAAATPPPAPPVPRKFVERVSVRTDRGTVMVALADVHLLEASGNYVTLHTERGRHLIRESLTALESRLDPARFVRVHRRFIVDFTAAREVQPWFGGDQVVLLRNGAKVRVSRRFREAFQRRLAGEA